MRRSVGGSGGVEDVLGVAGGRGLPDASGALRNVEQDRTDARLWREVCGGLARLRRLCEGEAGGPPRRSGRS